MQAASWWLAAAALPTEPPDSIQGLSSYQSLSPTSTTGWVSAATCSGSARDVVFCGEPSRDRAPAQHRRGRHVS